MSECRVTKNTTNDTNFSHIFFNILNIIVDYFKTTLTSADTKQKKWLLIPKVASRRSWKVMEGQGRSRKVMDGLFPLID